MLTVNQAPAITSANSTAFTAGTQGSFSVTSTGFPNSTLSESGTLPSGVTFTNNSNGTATLAGTPAAGTTGTYPLTITANNGVLPNATQSFTLTVGSGPGDQQRQQHDLQALARQGSFSVTTTGFPNSTLSESGTLPNGVTFTSNANGTATLAGTPAAARYVSHSHHGRQRHIAQRHAEFHAHRKSGPGDHQRQQHDLHHGHARVVSA